MGPVIRFVLSDYPSHSRRCAERAVKRRGFLVEKTEMGVSRPSQSSFGTTLSNDCDASLNSVRDYDSEVRQCLSSWV